MSTSRGSTSPVSPRPPLCLVVAKWDHLTPASFAVAAYERALEPKRLCCSTAGTSTRTSTGSTRPQGGGRLVQRAPALSESPEPIADLVAGWPVGRAAVGVATVERAETMCGDATEVFPLASVTKLFTAYAVLVAVEEGTVGLDDPAGPAGSTVRHLLAHASGLPPEAGGPVSRVGTRRIYSNAGYEPLGSVVEERSGMAFGSYLGEAVLEPLGLSSFDLTGSPGWGGRCSLDDLLRFGQELLAPSLVAASTMADCQRRSPSPAWPACCPGSAARTRTIGGSASSVRDRKSPHWTGSRNSESTFGHFGRSGTFLWVDPDDRPGLRSAHGSGLRAVGDRGLAGPFRRGGGLPTTEFPLRDKGLRLARLGEQVYD